MNKITVLKKPLGLFFVYAYNCKLLHKQRTKKITNERQTIPRTKRHVDAERILPSRCDGLIKAEGVSE